MMDLIDDIVNLFKSLLDYLGIDANNLVSKLAYHFGLFFSLLFFVMKMLSAAFKCISGQIISWKQTIWTKIRLLSRSSLI